MAKKIVSILIFTVAIVPSIALAAEKSSFHIFYERTFGIIGAIAGIIAMVALWQISKKVETNFSYALKMFVAVLFFINIGSISFGVHGSGILSGETSRYIERVCRLLALLIADIIALMLFVRINKQEDKKKEME
ncbi:MAG: hypothetical protein U9O66_03575 [Patescibacteria group bacterium]|nr:hypothetical protein [Patescibacteria group bacterium]